MGALPKYCVVCGEELAKNEVPKYSENDGRKLKSTWIYLHCYGGHTNLWYKQVGRSMFISSRSVLGKILAILSLW